MKSRDWLYVISFLLMSVMLDQLSKLWAMGLAEQNFGILKLVVTHNHGAMLGLFSELPAVLRVVTLSTSGIFILSLYIIAQYSIPGTFLSLRISLSVLVGGILGNVLDRIFYGYVIDFIAIEIGGWHSPIWNVADIIQWIGYIVMLPFLIKHSRKLWPDKNDRKSFMVNRQFQIKHSLLFTTVGVLLTLISLVFSYTYFKVTLQELIGNNTEAINKFLTPFLICFAILTVLFSFILFSIGQVISHRIAGPIYAFERFLKEILEGKGLTKTGAALTLRNNDDFKHLEELAEQVKQKMAKIHSEKTLLVTEYTDED